MNRREFLAATGGAMAAAAVSRPLAAGAATPIVPDTMTLAATGDCILTRRVSELKDARFLRLVDVVRGADCAYGNCEMVLADPRDGYPMAEGAALSVVSDPKMAAELAWCGFDVMGTANNHSLDYGQPGLVSTRARLAEAGIAAAGTGLSLQEASAPAYVETPGGRVALVNCASTFHPYAVAALSRADFKGIPGLNPVRVRYRYQVDRTAFDALARAGQALKPLGPVGDQFITGLSPNPQVAADQVSLFGNTFVPGATTDVLAEVVPEDLTRITDAVKVARRNARLVIVSIHAHEVYRTLETPDRFLQPFARACIEAGADAFFGAGAHVLWGIEVYRGRPICYGLGDLFFQYQTVRAFASDVYQAFGLDPQTPDPTEASDRVALPPGPALWQTVVPVITYGARGALKMVLHPVTLGVDEPRYQRGTPRLAEGTEAEAIIARVGTLSRPYGTTVTFAGGVGEVQVGG
ncbi:MAG: CapA family protein [Acidobacteriota bacterium]|nr:CapA family protein [Acidobacteriota bacterium]